MGINKKGQSLILGSFIIIVQLFDIVVHVLTNQVEPIRIVSNIIIIAWVLSRTFSLLSLNRASGIGALILYLVLNTIFILNEGILNAYGDYRVLFFILILMTSFLFILFIRKTDESGDR